LAQTCCSAWLERRRSTLRGPGRARRSPSRTPTPREVKLPLAPPFTDPELTAGPMLRSLVKLLLGERVELDTFSYIESSPGSLDQDWHSDAPTPATPGAHAPPVGLVAVVPLVDVGEANGATEFLAGSHVDVGDERFWMEDEGSDGGACNATPHLQVAARAGSVVLFDLRLRHRGRANRGAASRPVLYMSYVKEWFHDGVNFKQRQSQAWDGLSGAGRRLFARLDTREYVKRLERELEERGVDLRALQAGAEYRRGQLEL